MPLYKVGNDAFGWVWSRFTASQEFIYKEYFYAFTAFSSRIS